jgi:hypothetical protein
MNGRFARSFGGQVVEMKTASEPGRIIHPVAGRRNHSI